MCISACTSGDRCGLGTIITDLEGGAKYAELDKGHGGEQGVGAVEWWNGTVAGGGGQDETGRGEKWLRGSGAAGTDDLPGSRLWQTGHRLCNRNPNHSIALLLL